MEMLFYEPTQIKSKAVGYKNSLNIASVKEEPANNKSNNLE